MYDVAIVGAGPAGIFASLKLIEGKRGGSTSVIIVDKGPDLGSRRCPAAELRKVCIRCPDCPLNSGWGGAGLFSDGKITLSPAIGGWLSEVLDENELSSLLKEMDDTFVKFGAPKELHGSDKDGFDFWHRKAALIGLRLEPNILRHIGTDQTKEVLAKMKNHLSQSVEISLGKEVKHLLVKDGVATGLELSDGEMILARCVIVAPGRSGSEWLLNECSRLGIETSKNPVDLGIRLEAPYEVLAPITDVLYEPKLKYVTQHFDDEVRTFCVNPQGYVITERFDDIVTVNGHSMNNDLSQNTNFALLVSTNFTEPFKDPIAYGKYIARLANNISNGIIVQRLGDLIGGQRSTTSRIERSAVTPTLQDATPGDLSYVLPFRVLTDIVETIKEFDRLIPGAGSKDVLLYGVEAKFYSSRVKVKRSLETISVKNLFVAGDGAGLTRGLSQAAVSGMHVAKHISDRLRS